VHLQIETETWKIQGMGDEILTESDYQALVYPPCPVCGGKTTGYPIRTRLASGEDGIRVSPEWNCRKGCHPSGPAIGGEPTHPG
jgi:hypothetical protein